MIWHLIKKQLLIFLRNRQELIILLGMPILLITILGFALDPIMSNQSSQIRAHVALVEQGDEQVDIEQFLKEVNNHHMSSIEKETLIASVKQIHPVETLKNDVLLHHDQADFLELTVLPPTNLENSQLVDTYDVIIEVPELFTYHLLQTIFLGEGTQPQLTLYKKDGKILTTTIVEDIITKFQQQFSLYTTLELTGISTQFIQMNNQPGSIATVTEKEPINAKTYYTVGMSVMFVLYIVSYAGSHALHEKQTHVFDRILLANVSRWTYFFSIFLSALSLAYSQLLLLYGVCAVFFKVYWPDVATFLLVSFLLSFAVAGLTVLLTSISYQANSIVWVNMFANFIVSIFAFLGGSFFPVGNLSTIVQFLGNLTPNGAGMAAFLKLQQGYVLQDIYHHLLFLFIFGITMFVIGIFIFPKKGAAS